MATRNCRGVRLPRAAVIAAGCVAVSLLGVGGAYSRPAAAVVDRAPADPSSLGSVTFYNAVGSPLTNGTDLTHLADYAEASSPQAGTSQAAVVFALPAAGVSDPQLWKVSSTSSPTTFPTAALGSSLSAPTQPTATLAPSEADLAGFLAPTGSPSSRFAASATATIVEARLLAGSDGQLDPTRYWTAWLSVDSAGGGWQLMDQPSAQSVQAGTTPTTLTAISVQPEAGGTMPTLTTRVVANDGSHPLGMVALLDADKRVATATYNTSTGVAGASPTLVSGTVRHRYRFSFVPADPTQYQSGSSAELLISSAQRTLKDVDTTLIVSVAPPADAAAYGTTTLAAWIRPAGALGTVEFSDSINGKLGSVQIQDGFATLLTNALGAGKHSITAHFTPIKGTHVGSAESKSASFTLTGKAQAQDPQTATVNVTSGQLTITTPYTPDHPFSLGNLVLNSAGTKLFATAHFGSAGDAALRGITITDSRAGDQPWTASVASTNFVSGRSAISAENLGFIDVRRLSGPGGLGGVGKPVKTHDLPAAPDLRLPTLGGQAGLAGAPKAFATAQHGGGSVYVYGDMALSAPTTTPVGEYTATLTFTVG